jgi:hypothetical protein
LQCWSKKTKPYIELIAIAEMNGNYSIARIFPYLLVAQFGPTVAAVLVVYASEGKRGLADLFRKIMIFRFPFKSYLDITASLMLGGVWIFWHLPIFIFPDWRDGVPMSAFFILYPASVILFAYFITKVWRMTRGSVFIAIWVHGIINFIFSYLPTRKICDLGLFSNVQVNLIILSGLFLCCIVIHFLSAWRYSDQIEKRMN